MTSITELGESENQEGRTEKFKRSIDDEFKKNSSRTLRELPTNKDTYSYYRTSSIYYIQKFKNEIFYLACQVAENAPIKLRNNPQNVIWIVDCSRLMLFNKIELVLFSIYIDLVVDIIPETETFCFLLMLAMECKVNLNPEFSCYFKSILLHAEQNFSNMTQAELYMQIIKELKINGKFNVPIIDYNSKFNIFKANYNSGCNLNINHDFIVNNIVRMSMSYSVSQRKKRKLKVKRQTRSDKKNQSNLNYYYSLSENSSAWSEKNNPFSFKFSKLDVIEDEGASCKIIQSKEKMKPLKDSPLQFQGFKNHKNSLHIPPLLSLQDDEKDGSSPKTINNKIVKVFDEDILCVNKEMEVEINPDQLKSAHYNQYFD